MAAWSLACATTLAASAAKQGELEAVIKAIELAQHMELKHLYFLTDAMDLVPSLQSNWFDQQPHLAARLTHSKTFDTDKENLIQLISLLPYDLEVLDSILPVKFLIPILSHLPFILSSLSVFFIR